MQRSPAGSVARRLLVVLAVLVGCAALSIAGLAGSAHAQVLDSCCLPDGQCAQGDPTQCEIAGGIPVEGCQNTCVPPGIDCWTTECGRTQFSFCNNPIPADFFDPGSEPFDGVVRLGGGPAQHDTQVARLQPMVLDQPGDSAQVPIQIQHLDLVSCQPITVETRGEPQLWDVRVGLSETPSSPGQMHVQKTHPNGGMFESVFFVRPVFVFTRVGNPTDERILDPDIDESLRTISGPNPWVHAVDPGVIRPEDICGSNFIPGVFGDRDDAPSPECIPPGGVCCGDTGHAGPNGSLHVTGQACIPCKCGACCDPASGDCDVFDGFDPAGECAAAGRDYKGHGTSCADTDNDGIPDVNESHHCCDAGAQNPCATGSDPTNRDTDGDGIVDGADPDVCVVNKPVPTISRPWGMWAMASLVALAMVALIARRRAGATPA